MSPKTLANGGQSLGSHPTRPLPAVNDISGLCHNGQGQCNLRYRSKRFAHRHNSRRRSARLHQDDDLPKRVGIVASLMRRWIVKPSAYGS